MCVYINMKSYILRAVPPDLAADVSIMSSVPVLLSVKDGARTLLWFHFTCQEKEKMEQQNLVYG